MKQFLGSSVPWAWGFLGVVVGVGTLAQGDVWMWATIGLVGIVIAQFVAFHHQRLADVAAKSSLTARIDDLHREGINLLADLSVPVPSIPSGQGSWQVPLEAPAERWDQLFDFDNRVRALFKDEYPALLSDYADQINELRRAKREKESHSTPDNRSDSKKLREFATQIQMQPARECEAILGGLAAARHRAGGSA